MIDLTRPIQIQYPDGEITPGRLGPDLADGYGGVWHTIIVQRRGSTEELILKFTATGSLASDSYGLVANSPEKITKQVRLGLYQNEDGYFIQRETLGLMLSSGCLGAVTLEVTVTKGEFK